MEPHVYSQHQPIGVQLSDVSTSSSSSNLSPFAAPFTPRDLSISRPPPSAIPSSDPGRYATSRHGSVQLHTSASSSCLLDTEHGQYGALKHSSSYPAGLDTIYHGGGGGDSMDKTRHSSADTAFRRPASVAETGPQVTPTSTAPKQASYAKKPGPVVRILQRAAKDSGEFRGSGERGCEGGRDSAEAADNYLLMLAESVPLPQASTDCSVPVGFERDQRRRSRSSSVSSSTSSGSQTRHVSSHSSAASVSSGSASVEIADLEGEYDIFDGLPLWKTGDEEQDANWDDAFGSRSESSDSDGSARPRESRLLKLMQANEASSDARALKRCHSLTEDVTECSVPKQFKPRLFRTASAPEGENFLGMKPTRESTLEENVWLYSLARNPHGQPVYRSLEEIQSDFESSCENSEAESENQSDGDRTLLADSQRDENGNVLDGHTIKALHVASSGRGRLNSYDVNGNMVEEDYVDPNWQAGTCEWNWQDHLNFVPAIERGKLRSDDSGFASVSDLGFPSVKLPVPKVSYGASSSPESEATPQRQCPEHNHEHLTLYCCDCCQPLCPVCFSSGHTQCRRVLTTSLACRDLKWQLLKLQSSVGSGISRLEARVHQLKPSVKKMAERKESVKQQLEDQLSKAIEELRAHHDEMAKELDEVYLKKEKQIEKNARKVEKSLLLLHYVSKFLEVLRQRDSGWELLTTFDRRLSRLLQSVLHKATNSVDCLTLSDDFHDDELQIPLISCKKTALSLALDVLESADSFKFSTETADGCAPSFDLPAVTEGLFSSEWGSTWPPNESTFNSAVDDSGWESFIKANTSQSLSSQDGDGGAGEGGECSTNKLGRNSLPLITTSSPKAVADTEVDHDKDEDALIREILSYMQRFPPPANSLPVRGAPSLYSEMIDTPSLLLSASELIDDVFQFDEVHLQGVKEDPSGIFTSHHADVASGYRLQQRLALQFPEDVENAFITDLHVTETGRMLFVDAANHCLKRMDLNHPPLYPPARLHVPNPLALCSAGWERVMVSCAGRTLGLYSVGGFGPLRPVATRSTRQQYRGLVRASDALVAAASPETRSVDLLDLGGRVLRSIMPVDFVRGPEVVGTTYSGELLVVHQPANPPTVLLCFDMGGNIVWEHEMRTRSRHVSCSKVVGGQDGSVYYALQGDSAVYRLNPNTGKELVLLNSHSGVKFPSSLAVDDKGRVLVTRNELPTVQLTSLSQLMLPTTTEVDIFINSEEQVSG